LAERSVRQAEVVLSFDVLRIELQILLKRLRGFVETVFAVLGAAHQVPAVSVLEILLERTRKPFVGVGVIAEDNVIERNDFKVECRGHAVLGAFGEFIKGVFRGAFLGVGAGSGGALLLVKLMRSAVERSGAGLDLAEEKIAAEEVRIGGVGMCGEIKAKEVVGVGKFALAEKGFGLGELRIELGSGVLRGIRGAALAGLRTVNAGLGWGSVGLGSGRSLRLGGRDRSADRKGAGQDGH
jgi:hypothetical protein